MRIQFTPLCGGKSTNKLSEVVSDSLDGAEYDRGELETLSATCDNLREAFGVLMNFLVEKLQISEVELQELFDDMGFYYVEDIEFIEEENA